MEKNITLSFVNSSEASQSIADSSSTTGPEAKFIEESQDSSYIEFKYSSTGNNNPLSKDDMTAASSIVGDAIPSTEDTQSVGVNWRRPGRRYHSLNPESPVAFLYIQMQLCRKHSLREWLIEHADRNKDDVLDIFKQILSAVIYVHLQG